MLEEKREEENATHQNDHQLIRQQTLSVVSETVHDGSEGDSSKGRPPPHLLDEGKEEVEFERRVPLRDEVCVDVCAENSIVRRQRRVLDLRNRRRSKSYRELDQLLEEVT